jgi:hypothetical protein
MVTILGTGAVLFISQLNSNLISLNTADQITIVLLGLLAGDALSERMTLLERIESELGRLSIGQTLRGHGYLPSVEEQAAHASEICIAAMSGIALLSRYHGFFERKMKGGCNIRIVLLDPNSSSLQTLDLLSEVRVAKHDTLSSLGYLGGFSRIGEVAGKCEVRLSTVFLPFSMFAVDLSKDAGSMVVEFLAYKMPFSERPHVFLTKQDSPHWFEFYQIQFEKVWSDSSVWEPPTGSS